MQSNTGDLSLVRPSSFASDSAFADHCARLQIIFTYSIVCNNRNYTLFPGYIIQKLKYEKLNTANTKTAKN